jgi:hypothetical protein
MRTRQPTPRAAQRGHDLVHGPRRAQPIDQTTARRKLERHERPVVALQHIVHAQHVWIVESSHHARLRAQLRQVRRLPHASDAHAQLLERHAAGDQGIPSLEHDSRRAAAEQPAQLIAADCAPVASWASAFSSARARPPASSGCAAPAARMRRPSASERGVLDNASRPDESGHTRRLLDNPIVGPSPYAPEVQVQHPDPKPPGSTTPLPSGLSAQRQGSKVSCSPCWSRS